VSTAQANNSPENPEIGKSLKTGSFHTNYHDVGAGRPVILLHGSGAGVSGWANWRGQMGAFSQAFRVVVPDLVGFGYTERPKGIEYRFMQTWVDQMLQLMDGLAIDQADFVGNSFGGTVTLALAIRAPRRVRRMVLMGSAGVPLRLTRELDELWGYTPSVENMKHVMKLMAYNEALVTDDIAQMRYKASLNPGVQEAFEQLFPAPRQRWLDASVQPEDALRALPQPTLVVHGREDRVVPLAASLKLAEVIPDAQLHVFGRCGHWTMIEHRERFNRLVADFFSEQ
jgi:2-hydroxymuconate-semialdehyde hydrolase